MGFVRRTVFCSVACVVCASWAQAESSPAGVSETSSPGVGQTSSASDEAALDGLLLDLERVVLAQEASGWFLDAAAQDDIHAQVMESVCRVTPRVRALALAQLDHEQTVRGDPRALYEAKGRLDTDVEVALRVQRRRDALRRATDVAQADCPFWVNDDEGFRGLHVLRRRFVLSLETGGVAQLRRTEGAFTIGGGGVGRLLAGYGFAAPVSLLGGFELGGGAMLEPNTQPTQFVVNYFPAVPVVVRLHHAAWHYDFEVAGVSLFQAGDPALSYGLRGGFTVGVSALRTRGIIPWAGAALAYDYYFESGGRQPAQFLRGGLRIGASYDPF